jgi:hypothetical protein
MRWLGKFTESYCISYDIGHGILLIDLSAYQIAYGMWVRGRGSQSIRIGSGPCYCEKRDDLLSRQTRRENNLCVNQLVYAYIGLNARCARC